MDGIVAMDTPSPRPATTSNLSIFLLVQPTCTGQVGHGPWSKLRPSESDGKPRGSPRARQAEQICPPTSAPPIGVSYTSYPRSKFQNRVLQQGCRDRRASALRPTPFGPLVFIPPRATADEELRARRIKPLPSSAFFASAQWNQGFSETIRNDFVAVYALGLLSRLEDTATGKNASRRTHQLAFFWTPFLLIHLGGQDTVTAFAIEDNSLWLRHLLNLVVQVNLALYAFWKSTSDHRTQLLLPSIFVFVTGIIKYGERTWALNLGNLKSITSSNVPVYVQRLGGSIVRDSCLYADIVFMALYSMRSVRFIFGDVTFYHDTFDAMGRHYVRPEMLPKFLEVELGLMYADIYTKAMVLRTKSGIILRSVSQVSIAAAFVLFCVSNKQRYDSVDVAITYVLFVGGFLLEVCAMSMGMVSPWTCAWLKDKNWDVLSRFILSKVLLFGWWQNRPLWSNSMGQYNLLNYLGQYDRQSSPWKRRLMTTIRKVANIVGAGSAIKLWVSKLLDAKIVKVDEETKACVIQSVLQYKSDRASMHQQWLNLGPFIQKLLLNHGMNFGRVIVLLHVYTEVQLSRYSPTGEEDEAAIESLIGVCRKLSHYMIYLLALLPETLPVKGFETLLRLFVARYTTAKNLGTDNAILRQAMEQLEEWRMPEPQPFCTEAILVEMKEAWVQLLIYAADRCPPQVHAAQLARGGELLTFVWLLAAHYQLRDTGIFRIELTNVQPDQTLLYALHLQQDRGAS